MESNGEKNTKSNKRKSYSDVIDALKNHPANRWDTVDFGKLIPGLGFYEQIPTTSKSVSEEDEALLNQDKRSLP